MTKNELFEKFRGYLIGGGMKQSSSSYIAYIKDLDENSSRISDLLDSIANGSRLKKQLLEANEIQRELDLIFKGSSNPLRYKKGDYIATINKLIDLLRGDPCINKRHPLAKKHGITLSWVIKGAEQEPFATPWQGKDFENERITYGNVPEDKQVPQLCSALEGEYERILAFAREMFGDWLDSLCPRRIPVILKKECPSRIYLHDDEYIQRKINELIKRGEEVSVKETIKILRHTMRITGVFVSEPEPHIIIYFNQFKSCCWDDYIAQIAQTLAHEYMHYLEYEYCRLYSKKSYVDERVSEALADFFGVLFSIKCDDKYSTVVAEDRYDCWVKWNGSGWPYAYALYFINNMPKPLHTDLNDYYNYKNIDKLREVLKITPIPKDAYNKLTKL